MTDVWECWVLNTSEFKPSIYTNFNFNSYAVCQGRFFGCKADGIYELTGDTDDGTIIQTRIITAATDFGSSRDKRFRRARLGVSGDASTIKVETETGDTGTYSLIDGRATISRAVRGKMWTFTINGFDELEFIELVSFVLTR